MSVNIDLDRLRLVWIDHYWSRLVNIGLDGLKYEKVWVNIGKDWLIYVIILIEAYQYLTNTWAG